MTCATARPAAGEEIGTRLGRGGRLESGDGRAEHQSGVFPRAREAREPIVRNRGSSCHDARWRRSRHRAPWRLRTPTLDGLLRPHPRKGTRPRGSGLVELDSSMSRQPRREDPQEALNACLALDYAASRQRRRGALGILPEMGASVLNLSLIHI